MREKPACVPHIGLDAIGCQRAQRHPLLRRSRQRSTYDRRSMVPSVVSGVGSDARKPCCVCQRFTRACRGQPSSRSSHHGRPPGCREAASSCAQHGGDDRVKVLEGVGRSDLEQTARRRSRVTGPAARPALKEAGRSHREPTNRNRIRGGVSPGKRTIDREPSRPRASAVDPAVVRGTSPSSVQRY